jgi:hypothetical protein
MEKSVLNTTAPAIYGHLPLLSPSRYPETVRQCLYIRNIPASQAIRSGFLLLQKGSDSSYSQMVKSRCIPDTWVNLLFTSKATTTPAAPAHHAPPQRACPGPKLVESSTPRSCCARSDVGRCSTVCGRHGSRNWQKLRYATCTQQDPLPDLLPNEKLMDSR